MWWTPSTDTKSPPRVAGRPGSRLLVACAVLIAGTALAMVFRRPDQASRAAPKRLLPAEPLVVRRPEGIGLWAFGRVAAPTAEILRPIAARGPRERGGRAAARPIEPAPPPPLLARAFPQPRSAPAAEPPPGGHGEDLPAAAGESLPRRHKIVDGDTLGELAQRYLGERRRAMEIFEANRDVLTDPEVLPIGVELTIPPQRAVRAGHPRLLVPPAPLVPVGPAGSIPRGRSGGSPGS